MEYLSYISLDHHHEPQLAVGGFVVAKKTGDSC